MNQYVVEKLGHIFGKVAKGLDDEVYLVVGASSQLSEALEGLGEAQGQPWETFSILQYTETSRTGRGLVVML